MQRNSEAGGKVGALIIGDEILSKDWCKAAEVLGIAAKPEDAKEVQKATLSRLDAFVAEHLAPAPKGIV